MVPQRGARSTGVGTADERPRMDRKAKAVVEARILKSLSLKTTGRLKEIIETGLVANVLVG